MKFGKVDNPSIVDFTLPADHAETKRVLNNYGQVGGIPEVYVGCAKWNRKDLKNFYPRGTKDDLTYYADQFNAIELNASFYRFFPPEQFEKWKDRTADDFKFFPKLPQNISHWDRLKDSKRLAEEFLFGACRLEEKFGCAFLQMNHTFKPTDFDRVEAFVNYWPEGFPLTIEFRHTDWYNDPEVASRLYKLLEEKGISNSITDTAGRRDMMHMRLTTPWAFVRFVGTNHESDFTRVDDWIDRIETWTAEGLRDLYFFIHQHMDERTVFLASYFVERLNDRIGTQLRIPSNLEKA